MKRGRTHLSGVSFVFDRLPVSEKRFDAPILTCPYANLTLHNLPRTTKEAVKEKGDWRIKAKTGPRRSGVPLSPNRYLDELRGGRQVELGRRQIKLNSLLDTPASLFLSLPSRSTARKLRADARIAFRLPVVFQNYAKLLDRSIALEILAYSLAVSGLRYSANARLKSRACMTLNEAASSHWLSSALRALLRTTRPLAIAHAFPGTLGVCLARPEKRPCAPIRQ